MQDLSTIQNHQPSTLPDGQADTVDPVPPEVTSQVFTIDIHGRERITWTGDTTAAASANLSSRMHFFWGLGHVHEHTLGPETDEVPLTFETGRPGVVVWSDLRHTRTDVLARTIEALDEHLTRTYEGPSRIAIGDEVTLPDEGTGDALIDGAPEGAAVDAMTAGLLADETMADRKTDGAGTSEKATDNPAADEVADEAVVSTSFDPADEGSMNCVPEAAEARVPDVGGESAA